MSSSPSISSPLNRASQGIIDAETPYLVGIYRVVASQVKRHPHQRLVSKDWVDSLHKHFLNAGVDREAHPIKVILENNGGLTSIVQSPSTMSSGSVPWLLSNLTVLVYHGQHRIEACNRLEDEKERWWYAEVYKQELETQHPAEFLTLMHTSNEDQYRLTTNDYDRFTVAHRLMSLSSRGIITEEVYQANVGRVIRSATKEGTRHGLLSLIRSQELSDSVAKALEYPALRPTFNAGTWGKKLTKGRFYQLSASLVDEMVQQCCLLQGDWSEVSSRPFQLTAQSCTLKTLESAVNKKNHPWKELPGGAVAALSRVSSRPDRFLTILNPRGSDGWTFSDTVLLPAVLTSDIVGSALDEMCEVAQHFIHLIAGEKYLERYTTTSPNISTDSHPRGIISHILRHKLGGKPSNYPDKIIHFMWENRSRLLQDLEDACMDKPSLSGKEKYIGLINQSEGWWSLLRMLKLPVLTEGLGLSVPATFGVLDSQSRASSLSQSATIRRPPGSSAGNQLQLTPSSTEAPLSSSSPTAVHEEDPPLQRCPESAAAPKDDTRRKRIRSPEPTLKQKKFAADTREMVENNHTFNEDEDEEGQRDEEDGEPLGVYDHGQSRSGGSQPTLGYLYESYGLASPKEDRILRCHSNVTNHLQKLEKNVPQMTLDEARALDKLMKLIVSLQGTGYLVRVVEGLAEKAQVLTDRAQRASQAVEQFEQREGSLADMDTD